VPTPGDIGAMTHVVAVREPTPLVGFRSTVVVSGLGIFREGGFFDQYCANLDAKSRDALLSAPVGTWLPAELALAHFAAVDAIGLTPEQCFDIGGASARRFSETLWGTALRMARAAAAIEPWNVFDMYERLWRRSFDGGGFVVTRCGPKEALVELKAMPFARHAYFRDALRGTHHALLGLFARTLYVNEEPRRAHPEGFSMRVSWV
jgi:hypothetical protein